MPGSGGSCCWPPTNPQPPCPTLLLSQEPEAIRIQIEQSGQLLVLLLLSATYLAVLVGISPWLLLAVALMGAASMDWREPGLASP